MNYNCLKLVIIKNSSKIQIGLSDHFNGPLSGPVRFLYGAKVFEKHVTFNRAWKGTVIHLHYLYRFEQFVKDINRANLMGLENKSSDQQIGKICVFNWKIFMQLKKLIKMKISQLKISLEKFLLSMEFQ